MNASESFLRRLLRRQPRVTSNMEAGFGIGIGPFHKSAIALGRHMSMLGMFDVLVVRDRKSFDFLQRYQFHGKCLLGTDMAFLKSYWTPTTRSRQLSSQSRKLGIVLQDLGEQEAMCFQSIRDFVKMIPDVEVTFFSFDENHDKNYIRGFAEYDVQVWRPDKDTLHAYLHKLASQEVIISARAHGAILGAVLGAIPVCLGISQKLEEVSRYFSDGELLIPMPCTAESLLRLWNDVAGNLEEVHAQVRKKVHDQWMIAEDARKQLFSWLPSEANQ